MNVIECIQKRRTVRKYINKKIPREIVSEIIESGRLAPSSGNLQNWKFILVDNDALKSEIAHACGMQLWMQDASNYIVICSENDKIERFYGLRGDRLYAIQNCAAAIENMLLSATHFGLGSAWIGAFDEDRLKSALGIPDDVRPQAIIVIGYSAEKPEPIPKYRLYDICYIDGYRNRVEQIEEFLQWPSIKTGRYINKIQNLNESNKKKFHQKLKDLGNKIKDKFKRK